MTLSKCALWLAGSAFLAAPAFSQDINSDDFLKAEPVEMMSEPVVQGLPSSAGTPLFLSAMNWDVSHARALLRVIEGIGAEGLDPADYRPAALLAAIEMGRGETGLGETDGIRMGGSPELSALASEVFTWLVEDLRDGRTPMDARRQWFVVDPDADLLPTSKVMERALESGDVSGVLAALNPTHPDYAALKAALADVAEDNIERRDLIRANMDRWRWLARDLGSQYLITNVPEYQLRLTVNDRIIRTYRTIVGKPGRSATPQLAETVEGVIFNPTWTVPQSIVKGEGLGNRVLNNPNWARANSYKATKGAGGFITVVQQPGPRNSLGLMKLDMPNRHAIFLHDTPARHLFANTNRALSHGCIRTERALELAMTIAILGRGATKEEVIETSTSRKYTRVPVVKTMPVYITYFTIGRDIDGDLRSFSDIYNRDAPVLKALHTPRVGNRARETSEEAVEIIDDLRIS